MNNNVIRMVNDNKAQVSKTFMKNSKIYGTPEYKLMREFKAENPNCEVVVKTIKKNPNKKTNKNLTYENMEIFINEQEKAEILKSEFEKVKKMSKVQKSPYDYVLEWFKNKFKNYKSYETFFKNIEEQKKAEENESKENEPNLTVVNGN